MTGSSSLKTVLWRNNTGLSRNFDVIFFILFYDLMPAKFMLFDTLGNLGCCGENYLFYLKYDIILK